MQLPVAITDDETTHSDYYVAALRGLGIEARHFKSPDSLLSAMESGDRFSLFVVDMMMKSYGRYSTTETRDFMSTGVLLVRDIRLVEAETPVIVSTNLNIATIVTDIKKEISKEPNVFFVRKCDYPPHELAVAINSILEGDNPFAQRRGILQRFWDSLVLEPKVFGMGVDIKKLADRP